MADLHDPLVINGMRLRNRLSMAPITTNFASADGLVTDAVVGYYLQRAVHVGMVVVEAAAIRSDGRIKPRSLGLWNDRQVRGMAALAGVIKREGAAAVAQLVHAGARAEPAKQGICGASPSGVAFRPDTVPTIIDRDQIGEIVDDFVRAAVRVLDAGFDGVEVHGAHFYLLSQFLSPLTNSRQDEYGGDAIGRATLAAQVVSAIRCAVGPSYPVLFRLNAAELGEGRQTPAEAVLIAQGLEMAGIDAIDVSVATMVRWRKVDDRVCLEAASTLPKSEPRGASVPFAAAIKRSVRVPVIAVGKLGEATIAAKVLHEGSADVVAIGRQMIVDPLAAGKILSGRGNQVQFCRECMTCSVSRRGGKPMRCSTNSNLIGAREYMSEKKECDSAVRHSR